MPNPGKYFGMLLCIAGALSLAACGGGGGGGGDGSQAANTLTLIDVSVGDVDGVGRIVGGALVAGHRPARHYPDP